MRIAIFGLVIKDQHIPTIDYLFKALKEQNVQCYFYADFYAHIKERCALDAKQVKCFRLVDELPEDVALMVSIGGDGTLLKSFMHTHNQSIPVIGINTGRLGFLAAVSTNEIDKAIDLLLSKQYTLEERVVLSFCANQHRFSDYNYALNEVTVTKMDSSSMIRIHAYIDDEYLASYWADGLIISTATGSTAYSLSAGGPILPPQAKNFVITPISSHNLTVRPIVIPDTSKIELKVEGRGKQFLCSLDSRSKALEFPGSIVLGKADFKLKTIKLKGNDFFSTLRNKLLWGSDIRN